MSNVSAGRFLIDRGTDAKRASRTSWGEESYVKVGSTLSNSAYSILDYRAPAGFGVVRHLHHAKTRCSTSSRVGSRSGCRIAA
jgi:hypothetical protein